MANIDDANIVRNGRGFSTDQIVQRDGQPVLAVWNPLPLNYDGLPPKGTLLPGEPGDPTNCLVILGIDPDGNFVARRFDRPTQGQWQYLTLLGGMAVFHPSRGDSTKQQWGYFVLLG